MKTTHRILTAIAALSLAGVCPAEKPKKEKDGGGKPPEGAAVGALICAAVGESAAESKKLREKGREKVSKEAGEKAGAKPPKEAAPETGKEKRIAQAIKERLAARQKLGELARKAMELAQAGQHEEAQALRQKLRQLAEKLGDGRPDPMVERFQLFGDNPSAPEKGMPRPPMRPGAPAQPPQAAAPGFRPMPMPPRNAASARDRRRDRRRSAPPTARPTPDAALTSPARSTTSGSSTCAARWKI
ncbi:MAG: hypothetical protein R3F11_07535 [Verrucomicrobiales bacterium]